MGLLPEELLPRVRRLGLGGVADRHHGFHHDRRRQVEKPCYIILG
jgi:hypothetical protein